MSNKQMLGRKVLRKPMLGGEEDDPIDRDGREVVDYRDADPSVKAPGSVKIQGVGWWPADRVVEV